MRFILIFFTFFSIFSSAELRIPSSLSSTDKNTAVEVLGYGTMMKILGDPYPLGGYSGIEFGISSNIISSTDISRLGNHSTPQSETSYNMLTAGKGLYRNFDVHVGFAYAGQTENIQAYGMQARWGIYQAEYLPIYASLILSMANANFNNLILTNNYNLDLIFGFKEGDLTLYFGGGPVRAFGTFSGGTGGVTTSGNTEFSAIEGTHFLAGLNIKFDHWFTAFELDRNSVPTYSAKLGYRY